jgi:hypothetical protein
MDLHQQRPTPRPGAAPDLDKGCRVARWRSGGQCRVQCGGQSKASGISVWFSSPNGDFAGKGVCGDPDQVRGIVKTLVTSEAPIRTVR